MSEEAVSEQAAPREVEPTDVAAALHVSIGLFLRRLRHAPVQDELTVPEMSLLERLDRAGSATPGRLAKAEQISPQATGKTLGALEERGLIERRADPEDGRRAVMSLTDAGRQVLRHKRSARVRQLAKALADQFSAEELATLAAAAPLIERLGESL
jgi:DNA-binding MarR family transcriptional regulator